MTKLFFSLVGLMLGFLPAALLVLTDRSVGHGGDTIDLLFLLVLGIPGMTLGCFLGAFFQHRSKGRLRLLLTMGGCLGGVVGLFGGLFLREILRIPLREKDFMCLGLLTGGIIGIVIGGMFGGRVKNGDPARSASENG
jgi:hypothetical protein